MISKLSRRSSARKSVVANCATSLILFGQIETTLSRAKTIQPYIEKILTCARAQTLSSRRVVAKRLNNDLAVAKVFNIIVHNMSQRKSGFTSIYSTRNRHGDGAPCVLIALNKELFNVKDDLYDKSSQVSQLKKPIKKSVK